eukprot:TRINITY_DN248_c2_g1_i1.p1 TRINITY_DN248_c2_g1~~TRINITY_DN248_c2_g1_i1.p1  ORF type:complete len:400 (+),score=59.67 TRINITY_DN248_c2_g1_i1:68-1201(+)
MSIFILAVSVSLLGVENNQGKTALNTKTDNEAPVDEDIVTTTGKAGFLSFKTTIQCVMRKRKFWVAGPGSEAKILRNNKGKVDVLLNATTRFTLSSEDAADPKLESIMVDIDHLNAASGKAFLLTKDLSEKNLAGIICQVLYVDKITFNATVRCDSTETAFNVTRTDGYYVQPDSDNYSSKIEFRKDLANLEVNAMFRFTANRNDVAIVTNIPGKNGMLATVRTEKNDVFEIDHTMGVFVVSENKAKSSVSAEQESDDVNPFVARGQVLVEYTHVILFLLALYIVGKLGVFMGMTFNTVAGCGMNVTQLSAPLMVWFYVCLFFSKVWAVLDMVAVVLLRAIVTIFSSLKRIFSSSGAGNGSDTVRDVEMGNVKITTM